MLYHYFAFTQCHNRACYTEGLLVASLNAGKALEQTDIKQT